MPVSAYYAAAQYLIAAQATVAHLATASARGQVSEIADGESHRQVGRVMAWGVISSMSLACDVQAPERLGARFSQLSGTSVSGINVLPKALTGAVQVAKAGWLPERLISRKWQHFVDGQDVAYDFVRVPVTNGLLQGYGQRVEELPIAQPPSPPASWQQVRADLQGTLIAGYVKGFLLKKKNIRSGSALTDSAQHFRSQLEWPRLGTP